ncbi:MAG TPA: hypothetical protein P5121_12680 [Caldilineaceae bacterium]|nr:hypothetical protein [Caldilineaceae bacterium]
MIVWLKIVLVVGALVGLLVVVRGLGTRRHWHPEWQRKALHMALGLTATTFPWLFRAIWPVWTICGAGILIMGSLRYVPMIRRRLGGTLHDVQRDSTGELLFALAIALLFGLAHTAPVVYVVPLAILTVADSAAALVGLYGGRNCFATPFGRKSWEGVAAFVLTALGVTMPLLAWLTPLPWPTLLLVTATVVLLTTLVEAIAWHGHDNLLIPVAGYLTLTLALAEPASLLLDHLALFAGVNLLFVPLWQQLPTHTTLTGLLIFATLWLGGPLLWLAGLLVLLFGRLLRRQQPHTVVPFRLDALPAHFWLAFVG